MLRALPYAKCLKGLVQVGLFLLASISTLRNSTRNRLLPPALHLIALKFWVSFYCRSQSYSLALYLENPNFFLSMHRNLDL